MAGKQSGFDAKAFRAGITLVMRMGAPIDVNDQATFTFPKQMVYRQQDQGDFDGEGVPFDPSIPVTTVVVPSVKVPCAVEYFDAEGVVTDFGLVTPSRATITLLDEDYRKVKECNAVLLGGDRFIYRHTEFPSALFDVGLFIMHFTAENDL